MGMYDIVTFICSNCGEELQIQSKAGNCILQFYKLEMVPVPIALDIEGEEITCRCETTFRIKVMSPINSIAMSAQKL